MLAGISDPIASEQGAAKKKPRAKPVAMWRDNLDGIDFVSIETFDGAIQGFVFRTSEKGTGYHRDGGVPSVFQVEERAQPIPILLDQLIWPSVCSMGLMASALDCTWEQWPRSKRARRSRRPDGMRETKQSRRQVASLLARQGNTNTTCCPEVGSINDKWWRELGMWAI